ncbi:MAG: ATP-binding protein [Candidatus Promineifilaceae bacterium]
MASPKRLTIPGRYDRIREVCDFVVAGAEEAGFDPDQLFRIQLACDEACTNIIEHAYKAENVGDIRVSWQVEKGAFIIELRDNGRPFRPEEVPSPSVPENAYDVNDLKVGGLGLHFMKTLMDEVKFSFDNNGNRLIMVKNIG